MADDYPWKWSPEFKDYYKFRRRGVAGKSPHDLIWGRSMIAHEEQSPGSSTPPSPPSVVDPNENNAVNVPPTVAPNSSITAISYHPIPGAQFPNNPDFPAHFRDFSRVPLDLAHRMNNNSSPVYRYTVSKSYERLGNYFKKGRVFKVSWPEPKGDLSSNAPRPTVPERADTPAQSSLPTQSSTIDSASLFDGISNTTALHVKTRMFVVIRQKTQHCLCLPIYTYSQQATSKTGVKPEDHAPLIKANTEVEYHPDEQRDKLRKALHIILEDTTMQWSPLSRINLAKIQSVEYNLKVRKVGRISPDCLADLETLFREAIGLGED
ncbi:hypothetical protein N0V90_003841 [Kalmusia sp. IMI 367209]|nr:hypothetical protein N0V90_003841 [Kalmusia sp. IMI 367209]